MRKVLQAWTAALFLALILCVSANGATRPVSIGLNDNWEQWLARSTNVGWVRVDFVWSVIEPQRGVWDFGQPDAIVNESLANGQQVLAILHFVPAWASGSTNQNVPPLTTTDWAEFVRQVAIRYSGRVAAYEIWNEPDISNASQGIGWDRNVEEPPLYTDFVHAAAVQIRTYAPGTPVVGPAYKTYNDGPGSQADNRKRRFFQQMQAAVYADGPGPSFLDVTSYHNNAKDTEPSKNMGAALRTNNLSYLSNYLPAKSGAPVWVTEYGWRSNAVTEAGQREKECNLTKIYTGLLEAAFTGLGNYNITRSFIYVMKAQGSSASIFNGDNTPKPVVTQYLQRLSYPATQSPALSTDFPDCTAATFAASTDSPLAQRNAAFAAWEALGFADPRKVLPRGFSLLDGERSAGGRSVYLSFQGPNGAIVRVSAGLAVAGEAQFVNDSVAEWTQGKIHATVSLVSGGAQAKGWAWALASGLDQGFSQACVDDHLRADERMVRGMGFASPRPPKGFRVSARRLDLTRPSRGCGASKAALPKAWDFVWSFTNGAGDVIRAGIYRYGQGFSGVLVTPRSLHWSDKSGTRYWVAAEPQAKIPGLQDALYEVALSMDPELPL
jgi:hypothetical protein